MRFTAPTEFEGEVLAAELDAAGYEGVHVVCFEDGTLDITGWHDGRQVGEEDRDALQAVLTAHKPPPRPAPLPDPVPKLTAGFDRILDTLVEKKVLTPADRKKIKDGA